MLGVRCVRQEGCGQQVTKKITSTGWTFKEFSWCGKDIGTPRCGDPHPHKYIASRLRLEVPIPLIDMRTPLGEYGPL